MATHVLEIPDWRPTPLNQLIGNRHKSARLKKSDANVVAVYAILAKIPKATGKRRVELLVRPGSGLVASGRKIAVRKPCDPDAYHKSLLDALVGCGMLVDDSDKFCQPLPARHTTEGPPRSVVTLTDLD